MNHIKTANKKNNQTIDSKRHTVQLITGSEEHMGKNEEQGFV
jgi:hypothetical protein